MKYTITNSLDGLQYFLALIELEKTHFDKDGDWLKDVYKVGDNIEIIQSGRCKQGKRIPRIDIQNFEQHAKSVYRMTDLKEREKLTKKLIEIFIEFTVKNYDQWEDMR